MLRIGPAGLGVVLAAVLTVGLAPAAGGAASSTTRMYTVSGTTTSIPGGGCLDCLPFSSTTTGSATCSACLPGDPLGGTFTLSLPSITTYRPSRCLIKTISGTLRFTWFDGGSSTATVAGRFVDDKGILRLVGQFDDEPFLDWAGDQVGIVLNNYPSSPCVETVNPVSAVLVIST